MFIHHELLQLTVSFVPCLALQSVPKRRERFLGRHPRDSDWLDFPVDGGFCFEGGFSNSVAVCRRILKNWDCENKEFKNS